MKYGNCWIYAVSQWSWYGGAIIVEWSPRNVCIAHVMKTSDVETILPSRSRLTTAVKTFFRAGGYLSIWWRSDRSVLTHTGHTDSLGGVEVSEFIPLEPRRGVIGLMHAICFHGKVRTRVLNDG